MSSLIPDPISLLNLVICGGCLNNHITYAVYHNDLIGRQRLQYIFSNQLFKYLFAEFINLISLILI